MVLHYNRATLTASLRLLLPIVDRNSTAPELENFHLSAVDGVVTFSAANQLSCMSIKCTPDDGSSFDDASICIPVILLSTLEVIEHHEVTLRIDIEAAKCEMAAGDGLYHIALTKSKMFDSFLKHLSGDATTSLTGDKLIDALEATLPFVSTDELRPAMCCVLMHALKDGGMRCVATDGHRLSMFDTGIEVPESLRLLIPEKSARGMLHLLKQKPQLSWEVTINDSRVTLWLDGETVEFTSLIRTDSFPNYQAVVPVEFATTVEVSRLALIGSLKRIGVYANKSDQRVVLRVGKVIDVVALDEDLGKEAMESLEAHSFSGPPLIIGFNAKYLLAVAQSVESNLVTLAFNDESKPCVCYFNGNENGSILVMPIRIDTKVFEAVYA